MKNWRREDRRGFGDIDVNPILRTRHPPAHCVMALRAHIARGWELEALVRGEAAFQVEVRVEREGVSGDSQEIYWE